MRIFNRTPVLQRLLDRHSRFRTRDQRLLLTFDDGPHPDWTLPIARVLHSHQVHGVFFLRGDRVEANPDLVPQLLDLNMEIGLHSYHHRSYLGQSVQRIIHDIEQSRSILEQITGIKVLLIRPPYGYYGPAYLHAIRRYSLTSVLWNLQMHDYRPCPAEVLLTRAVGRQQAGDIVLLHDGSINSGEVVKMLPEYIRRTREAGLEFVQTGDRKW